jgi:hypothetical protein
MQTYQQLRLFQSEILWCRIIATAPQRSTQVLPWFVTPALIVPARIYSLGFPVEAVTPLRLGAACVQTRKSTVSNHVCSERKSATLVAI